MTGKKPSAEGFRPREKVKEIIGRVQLMGSSIWTMFRTSLYSVDATVTDYAFWDSFRRGKKKGYEFASLFARAITQIMRDWTMGGGVEVMLADTDENNEKHSHTNTLLRRFMTRIHALLLLLVEDLYGLGDQYAVVNLDGSISVPSPDTVEPFYHEIDYRRLVKVVITTKLEKATVTDEYREDGRTIRVKWADASRAEEVAEFSNLIGRIPVVHFANDRGVNERFGRTIYEPMLRLFSRYDDLVNKALDGAELMSNPIPVFEGMEDVNETVAANSTPTDEDYTDDDGNIVSRVKLAFDRLAAVVVGKGGSFKFASPTSGFTKDIRDMLKVLFLLVLDFTRIPEVIWGNELSSSRASAGEQMKTFYMFIESRRAQLAGEGADDLLKTEAKGGLYALIDIWLRTMALTDKQIVVAPVTLKWPELGEQNEEMRFKWVEWARAQGLLTDKTSLAQANIVPDVDAEVDAAKKEAAERDPFEAAVDEELNRRDDDDTDEDEDIEDKAA